MADSRFALEWRDARGSKHLSYNHRLSTIDRDGNERVLFYHDTPPTFESTYEGWRVGTAYEPGHYGKRPIGDLYTMLLRKGELGRTALDRFLTGAAEAGYDVARWFSGRRDRAGLRQGGAPAGTSVDGTPVQAMTFLLQKRPKNANAGRRQG